MSDTPITSTPAIAPWRPMETAPKDGTIVRLLVAFTEHPLQDTSDPIPTIGGNTFDNTEGDDVWQFAGWSWQQDCFTQGEGMPMGWLPLEPEASAAAGKYDDVLKPFLAFMEAELHANADKGDRPGWLATSHDQALLEVYYHVAKLQKAVRGGTTAQIREHAADVANMAMMLLDLCGGFEPDDASKRQFPTGAIA